MQNDVRLIDANALKNEMVEVEIVTPPHNHYCSEPVVFGYDIDDAPTIDAVPVVHARWVKDTYNGRTCCSSCKVDLPGVWYYNGEDGDENYEEIDSTPYCPNCGAKMDGGAADGSDA